jgi:hypothetical protein
MVVSWFYVLIWWFLFLHWTADFVFQSDATAVKKSKSWFVLALHASSYSVILALGSWLFIPFKQVCLVWAALFVSHFWIDALSSRVTSWLFKRGRRHEFFTAIGFDQLLHFAVILFVLDFLVVG